MQIDKIIRIILSNRLWIQIKSKDRSRWKNSAKLLASGELSKSNYSKIAILFFEEELTSDAKEFLSILESSLTDVSLIITSDIILAKKYDAQILLVSPGKITREQLRSFIQELQFEDDSVYGWIYIE